MSVPVPPTVVTGTPTASTDFNDLSDAVKWLLGDKPHAVLTRSSSPALPIPTGTDQVIVWGIEEVDNAGGHSNAVDPELYTAPDNGYYRVDVWIQYDVDSSGTVRQVTLEKNGVAVAGDASPVLTGNAVNVGFGMTVYLAAGDTLEVHALHNATGSLDIVAGRFAITWSHNF